MFARKAAIALFVAVASAATVAAQGDTFTAQLAWVPISGGDRANVTGRGAASATLTGTKLAITGKFDGLAAPVTVVRLHEGVAKGARGEVIGDLTLTARGTSGAFTGSFDLTREQVERLQQGRLYIQVHSEKGVAPDGSNLWGWLLR
jgi:CHRD domain